MGKLLFTALIKKYSRGGSIEGVYDSKYKVYWFIEIKPASVTSF